jgi:hypothetical protein
MPQNDPEAGQQDARHSSVHQDSADHIGYPPFESIEEAGYYTPDWPYHVPDVTCSNIAFTYLIEVLAYSPASNDRRKWNGANQVTK